jgi:translation initiation factor 3 subunit A
LCETLRSHLASSQKCSHQSHSINLSDPETLQRHLDTRFHQLNTAVELELWQEAFRTAEDIHGLVGMSKRPPKPSMMATYFEKLVKVFAVGNNFLFHAAAYGKYYTQLNIKDEGEASKAASLVLLSALAVPVTGDSQARRRDGSVQESDGQKSKTARLATLLGLSVTPTRADLIRDAVRLSNGDLNWRLILRCSWPKTS